MPNRSDLPKHHPSTAIESTVPAFLRRAPAQHEELEALWAMQREERVVAMRAGKLTQTQLFAWVQRHPDQCPLIDGEWEFIARGTPEVAEHKRPRRNR